MTVILYTLINGIYLMLALAYFPGDGMFFRAFTTLLYIVQQSLQTWLLLSDPGVAAHRTVVFEDGLSARDRAERFCPRCQIIRHFSVEHCYDCDVCIEGHDHHCPWSSKCISTKNMTVFYFWVGATLAFLFYAFTAVFAHLS